jgi:molybdate transport system substrate-binding protein
MRRCVVTVIAGLVAAGLAGCGSGGSSAGSSGTKDKSTSASASPSLSGGITVLAAASLKDSFTELGRQFQAAHPGVKVTFSFAASSALATQITSGAPADVFASASPTPMDQVVAAGAASSPKVFATNVMEIAVPPANPGKVTGVSSLASHSATSALCQPQVPCGATAAEVFGHAKVAVKPVTLEPDVKAVLSKVQLGEVDAGVVYVTDVLAAGNKVKGVQIPADVNVSTSYPIAALTRSANAAAASAFADYVLSPDGASVLAAAGFQKP